MERGALAGLVLRMGLAALCGCAAEVDAGGDARSGDDKHWTQRGPDTYGYACLRPRLDSDQEWLVRENGWKERIVAVASDEHMLDVLARTRLALEGTSSDMPELELELEGDELILLKLLVLNNLAYDPEEQYVLSQRDVGELSETIQYTFTDANAQHIRGFCGEAMASPLAGESRAPLDDDGCHYDERGRYHCLH